jgi:ketosteroid isomerase-like protein
MINGYERVTTVADPIRILRSLEAILDAFNAHDLDRVMSFFVDDCVLEMPRGPDPCGRRSEGFDAVRDALRSRFTGIPDVHYGNAEHFVSGDTGITQWTISGTSTAGQRIEVRGCDFYTFRDGKIAKKNSFWKTRE